MCIDLIDLFLIMQKICDMYLHYEICNRATRHRGNFLVLPSPANLREAQSLSDRFISAHERETKTQLYYTSRLFLNASYTTIYQHHRLLKSH